MLQGGSNDSVVSLSISSPITTCTATIVGWAQRRALPDFRLLAEGTLPGGGNLGHLDVGETAGV